jgi:hypothetical protein
MRNYQIRMLNAYSTPKENVQIACARSVFFYANATEGGFNSLNTGQHLIRSSAHLKLDDRIEIILAACPTPRFSLIDFRNAHHGVPGLPKHLQGLAENILAVTYV